jgi:hypothetical protein
LAWEAAVLESIAGMRPRFARDRCAVMRPMVHGDAGTAMRMVHGDAGTAMRMVHGGATDAQRGRNDRCGPQGL